MVDQTRIEHFQALASELSSHLSPEELNAIMQRAALPARSPLVGFERSPVTKWNEQPSKRPGESYEDKMAESAASLSGAIAAMKAGDTPVVHDELCGTWSTGVHSKNSKGGDWEKYEPRPEPVYTSRDPCPRCGTRGDIGCEHQEAYLAS